MPIFLVTILNSSELCKVRRDFDGLQTIDRQVFLKRLKRDSSCSLQAPTILWLNLTP